MVAISVTVDENDRVERGDYFLLINQRK